MPDLNTYFAFLAAVLLMQAVPGPDTILAAVRCVGQGRAVAFCTVFGMTVLAGQVQLPLLAFGLGAVARTFPAVFDVIRLAVAAYLVWLGLVFMVRSRDLAGQDRRRDHDRAGRLAAGGPVNGRSRSDRRLRCRARSGPVTSGLPSGGWRSGARLGGME